MGTDIAMVLSAYKYKVILKDLTDDILEQSRARLEAEFRMAQLMRPYFKSLRFEDILSRISFTATFNGFELADIVIENVTENWNLKERVYQEMESHCRRDVRYYVNTSCISITKIAALLACPDKAIGMHFMNPVYLKEVVELIPGFHTKSETVNEARAFLKTIEKVAVVANDMPGFIANRLSHLLMNEAAFLIQEQVASAKDVDLLFRKGYGHTMGPLETADLIGLDTVVHSLDVLYENYQDTKFRCCPLLRKMVDAGLKGKKSGQGFYKYNGM